MGPMETAILLAVAASLCTATASVCQRLGAKSSESESFDVRLVFRLARRPIWLLGVASMILGFVFQLTALHFGALALVQPILALELLFVFGYLAVAGRRRVKVRRRDWLGAAAMSAGIGIFLWEPPPGSHGDSWPQSSRNSAHTLATVSGPSSPPGRLTCSLPWVRRR